MQAHILPNTLSQIHLNFIKKTNFDINFSATLHKFWNLIKINTFVRDCVIKTSEKQISVQWSSLLTATQISLKTVKWKGERERETKMCHMLLFGWVWHRDWDSNAHLLDWLAHTHPCLYRTTSAHWKTHHSLSISMYCSLVQCTVHSYIHKTPVFTWTTFDYNVSLWLYLTHAARSSLHSCVVPFKRLSDPIFSLSYSAYIWKLHAHAS